MNYHQNNLGQSSSIVNSGVIGALLLTAFGAHANPSPVERGVHAGGSTNYFSAAISTSSQFRSDTFIPSIDAPLVLEEQVSKLYKVLSSEERTLDQQSAKILYENLWDLYVE